MKLHIWFILLFFVLFSGSASFAVDSVHSDSAQNPQMERMLAEMPDGSADPEAYNLWKIRYARMLHGEPPDMTAGIARTMAPMVLSTNNGYVDAQMDQSTGAFEEGARPTGGGSWLKLTYYYPSVPWSFSIYKIDGNTPEQQYRTGPDCVSIPSPDATYMDGDSIVTVWNNRHGVKIVQILEPVSLGAAPGDIEQIMYTTLFIPVDGSCHNCGCLVYYDTKLNANDGCPISTSFGYDGNAHIYFAPSIPSIWRAYENSYPPASGDLVALGILTGFEAVIPDVFWYGQWPVSYTNGWDDSYWVADATGTLGSDTATMAKWYPRNVCPGDTLRFVTYYGIGNITGTGLTLNHNPPDITASCAGVHPDPMTLTALITNMGTGTAHNVIVTLDLSGSVLVYSGGDPISTYFSSIAGYGGSQTVSWQVDIPSSAYGTTQCYDITVTYDEGDDITEHYCITIPDLLTPPSPSAWAEDYDLCEGECTFLHADPGIPGGGGSSCIDYSEDFNSSNGGYSSTGSWQWGTPTSGPGSAHSTPYCWATNLSGDYPDDASDQLVSAPIDLSGCSSATLSFWHWYSTESSWDGCQVFIGNSSSGPWTMLNMPGYDGAISYGPLSGENCYHGSSGGWVSESVDISSYVGSTVYIRFYFASDGSVNYPGWYIDDVTVSGDGGGSTTSWSWQWSPSTGLSAPNDTVTQACPTTTTTYTFTVTDGVDCIGTSNVTINVYPQPTVSLSDRTICYGESTTLTAAITGSYTSINWSTGASGVTYITASPTSTTDYWVAVCNNGCCDTAYCTVTVSPEIILDCGPDPAQICDGESITLTANVSGGISPYSFIWYPAGGLDNPMSQNPNASPTSSQWYYCTVTDNAGCDATDSVYVEVLPLPTAPVLISIPDGATDVPPGDTCLYWHNAGDVDYNVYFDGLLVASGITDTFWCTTLSCDETHTWFVQSENYCGTADSPTWTFTTETSPTGLSLLSPADGTTEIPPGDITLDWTDVSGSAPIYYNLYVDDTAYATGLTESQFDITVSCDDTIHWYVEAYNDCGTITSDTWVFYTQTGPDGITLSSPADSTDGIPAGDITLVWNEPTSGSSPFTYDVYVNGVAIATGLTSTSYDMTVACDDTIDWFVVAYNICGEDTSEIWNFTTQTSPYGISLIYPPDDSAGIIPGDLELVWSSPESGDPPFTYSLYIDGSLFADGLTDTTYHISVSCGESHSWFVIVENVCGEDTSDIWDFSTQDCGFPTAVLIEPFEGAWSACDDQNIIVWIFDPLGIDGGSIRFSVNGTEYDTSDSHLSYVNDTLYFVPDPLWSDGDSVYFCLDSATNIYGVPVDTFCSWFRVDLSAPSVYGIVPPPDTIIAELSPVIGLSLVDYLSGLNESSVFITVNYSGGTDTLHIGDFGTSWDGTNFYADMSDLGIEFLPGEIVQVCVHAEDSPDYCPPNALDSCWTFQIAAGSPVANLITPAVGTILSCADQQIILTITSAIDIEETTIQFIINGDTIGVDDSRLDWSPETLTFTPSPNWSDGDTVYWSLISADDILGDTLASPIDGWFVVDLTAPVVYEFYPPEDDTISVATPGVYIIFADSISGVDTSSIVFAVNGNPASYTIADSTDSGFTYWIINYDGSFPHNDSAEICLTVYDLVDSSYCPVNILDTCWHFTVDLYGPIVGEILDPASSNPLDSAISACGDQGFCVSLVDTEISHEVDPSSIVLMVDGVNYTIDDPELTYDGSNLCFTPSTDFPDGDVVSITLVSAEDYVGNPLSSTYSWIYTIDLSPPYIPLGAWPSDGEEIATTEPVVTFNLNDDIAGVDWSTFEFCVSISGGAPTCYHFGDAGLDSSGGTISANFADMGITLFGGDEVQVCVNASDSPDFCPPNELDTCWTFSIPVGGPHGTPLEPLDGTYSACDDQSIIIRLADLDGVVDSTILLSVNGVHYTTASAELQFFASEDSLVFTPSALWTDGEVVVCSLLAAEDIYGNPLEDAPVVWTFYIDLVPPVISGVVPFAGAHIIGSVPTVEMDITDAGSGVNSDSVYVSVNGTIYRLTSPCFSNVGSHYTLDLSCAGIIPDRGDTLQICIGAEDSPDYCPPNEIDSCYLIWIMDCDMTVHIDMDDTIICHPEGPVEFTINATVSGGIPPYTYSWSPPGAYVDGHIEDITATPPIGEVTQYIIQVTDSTGCQAYDTVYVTVSDPHINAGGDIWVCPGGIAVVGCSPVIEGHIVAPLDISWHYLDGTTISTDSIFEFTPESTVTLYAEIVDGAGCSDYDTVTVHYEHEAPGPFTYHSPEPNDTLPPGPVTLCWEMPSGDTPIYFDVLVDGVAETTGITDTCFTVGPFPCGERHTWFIEAYNLCSGIDCSGDSCGFYPSDSGWIDTVCTPVVVSGDTFAGGFDPPFYTEPCPTGYAEIIEPLDSTWSTCDDQQIIMEIHQPDSGLDIDPASIRLTVEGITYSVDGATLIWSDPTLTFTPPTLWTDGQVVNVCLDSVSDVAGIVLDGLPVCWDWFVDLTPPVFSNEYPTGDVYNWQAQVGVDVIDSLRTVNPDSFEIIIGGVFGASGDIILHWGDDGVAYDGTTLVISPDSVDTSAVGVDYSWCDDSQLVGGIYFPELDTIHIRVIAQDTIPDYCDPNEGFDIWQFYVPDDDIMPPQFTDFTPPYVSTRIAFIPTVEIYDSSGISDIAGYTPILVYDTDGEIVSSCDTVTMSIDTCWIDTLGITHCIYVTDNYVGPFNDTCTITFGAYAYDGDRDFCNDADMTPGDTVWTVPVLSGPQAEPIIPQPDSITACSDQEIIIHLWDPDGVDPTSITLQIEDSVYDISDPRLTYIDSTEELIFTPDSGYFHNEQVVNVTLSNAIDNLGNPMWDVLSYSFLVDLEAPALAIQFPQNGMMIRSNEPTMTFGITDNLAGINPSTIMLYVNGIPYSVDGSVLTWTSSDNMSGTLVFRTDLSGLIFPPGDTVWVKLDACDEPDYCDPNCATSTWWFTVEPEVGCNIHPNPFTPNGDNRNEITVFDYPNMYSEQAKLHIFNMRNVEVFSEDIGPIDEYSQFDIRSWDGRDNNGNLLPPGLYLYVIVKGGEVVCNGTVLLAR